jgi:hypothetical protein
MLVNAAGDLEKVAHKTACRKKKEHAKVLWAETFASVAFQMLAVLPVFIPFLTPRILITTNLPFAKSDRWVHHTSASEELCPVRLF